MVRRKKEIDGSSFKLQDGCGMVSMEDIKARVQFIRVVLHYSPRIFSPNCAAQFRQSSEAGNLKLRQTAANGLCREVAHTLLKGTLEKLTVTARCLKVVAETEQEQTSICLNSMVGLHRYQLHS